jgi:hypothetical protein
MKYEETGNLTEERFPGLKRPVSRKTLSVLHSVCALKKARTGAQ